jgi:hypothetical protein
MGDNMLRLHTPSGSIEALPQQEARVRALSNAQLVHELAGVEPDLFALAEAIDRALIVFNPLRGWHLANSLQHH